MLRIVCSAVLAAACLFGPAAADAPARPTPPSIEDFLADPVLVAPELSPSGRYLAYARYEGEFVRIVVDDLQETTSRVIVSFRDEGLNRTVVAWLAWKDEDRVLVGADLTAWITDRRGQNGYRQSRPNIYSIRREGGGSRRLLNHADLWRVRFLSDLPDEPGHVLMAATTLSFEDHVYKVDVATGEGVLHERGGRDVHDFSADRRGAVVARTRIVGRAGRGTFILEVRPPGETRWTEALRLRASDFRKIPDFELMTAAPEPGVFYVATLPSSADEGDTRMVRTYDLRTRTLGPVIWRHPEYDLDSLVIQLDDGEIAAFCWWADSYRCEWKDPEIAALRKGLQTFFGEDRNITNVSASQDGRTSVLRVSGPDDPGTYYLFDRTEKHTRPIGPSRFGLPQEIMGETVRVDYAARDGTRLRGYLTLPPGPRDRPAPLIVMPHGGPEARDNLSFDLWVQFLATRGYAVFRPQFRGSSGFGRRFAAAGYRQWGRLMQDDVEDGIAALETDPRVDAARSCVVGASYGGYVALWAAARTPDRHRCIVSIAGVTDLVELMEWERRNFKGTSRLDYLVQAIGDPGVRADRDEMAAHSPARFADRVIAPVLLLQGKRDEAVPYEQAVLMHKALQRAGKRVRFVDFDDGHGGWETPNEALVLRELEAFLAEHLPVEEAP